ncbi:hypothetical protein JKP88DRAFT_273677 [Tribonema minus]|uniref:Uncharacterized protein n=1 Tax=Tribonema minus TaxID=303371 RepID=A0A835YZ70_9STRA|nr:hypothetical protein JKP88DRAFT_273677 [Tribonema minus]
MEKGVVAPFMDTINAFMADLPGKLTILFAGKKTFADLMPDFIDILVANKATALDNTNVSGQSFITDVGNALAEHLKNQGFNTYDAAALEMYLSLRWAFVVTMRRQSVWDKQASNIYARKTHIGYDILQVIDKPLDKMQAGKISIGDGPLPVDIVAPPELHDIICLSLFVVRRLRALLGEEPFDLLCGLRAQAVQVDRTTYTNLMNEIGRIRDGSDRFGHHWLRHAFITAVCDTARNLEAAGHHQLAETTLNRDAKTCYTSRARFVANYDQRGERMMPTASMTPADVQAFIQRLSTGCPASAASTASTTSAA